MKTYSRLGLLAAAASLIATPLLAAGPAWASLSDTQTRSVTLRFDPRDLNSDAGGNRLLSRISLAANRVCDENDSILEQIESSSYRACRHDAITSAVAEVNRPTVTAAYNRHFSEKDRGLRAATAVTGVALRMVAVD
ncbi:MAG: UrcA family protein [Gammaproteobacteria bacterium]